MRPTLLILLALTACADADPDDTTGATPDDTAPDDNTGTTPSDTTPSPDGTDPDPAPAGERVFFTDFETPVEDEDAPSAPRRGWEVTSSAPSVPSATEALIVRATHDVLDGRSFTPPSGAQAMLLQARSVPGKGGPADVRIQVELELLDELVTTGETYTLTFQAASLRSEGARFPFVSLGVDGPPVELPLDPTNPRDLLLENLSHPHFTTYTHTFTVDIRDNASPIMFTFGTESFDLDTFHGILIDDIELRRQSPASD